MLIASFAQRELRATAEFYSGRSKGGFAAIECGVNPCAPTRKEPLNAAVLSSSLLFPGLRCEANAAVPYCTGASGRRWVVDLRWHCDSTGCALVRAASYATSVSRPTLPQRSFGDGASPLDGNPSSRTQFFARCSRLGSN